MAIYIAVTGLSLPGAAVLTLAEGGLFGLVVGTVAVSFASTIGATLACLVSRFFLREWVQSKFGDKLATINNGVEKEGAFYLFSLRLVPIFPFFVINLLMGLTRMRLSYLLLGVADRHVCWNHCFCQRRKGTGENRFSVRHHVARFNRFICCSRPFPYHREEAAGFL